MIYLERIVDGIQEIAKKVIIHRRHISNLKFAYDIDLLEKTYRPKRLQKKTVAKVR